LFRRGVADEKEKQTNKQANTYFEEEEQENRSLMVL
jgi:hypothetical protein